MVYLNELILAVFHYVVQLLVGFLEDGKVDCLACANSAEHVSTLIIGALLLIVGFDYYATGAQGSALSHMLHVAIFTHFNILINQFYFIFLRKCIFEADIFNLRLK